MFHPCEAVLETFRTGPRPNRTGLIFNTWFWIGPVCYQNQTVLVQNPEFSLVSQNKTREHRRRAQVLLRSGARPARLGSAPRRSKDRAAGARASGHLKVLRHREPEQNRENRSRAGFGADGSALKQQDEAEPSPRVRFWTRTDTNPTQSSLLSPNRPAPEPLSRNRAVTRPIQTGKRTEPSADQQKSDGTTRTGTRTCSGISECLAFCSRVLVLLGSSDVVPVLIRSRGPARALRAHGSVRSGFILCLDLDHVRSGSDGFISDIGFKIFEIKIFYFRFLRIKWTKMIIFRVRSFNICIKILKRKSCAEMLTWFINLVKHQNMKQKSALICHQASGWSFLSLSEFSSNLKF